MSKDLVKEIRITDEYTLQMVAEAREPGENTPAKTIQRIITENRMMKMVLDRITAPQPIPAPISA